MRAYEFLLTEKRKVTRPNGVKVSLRWLHGLKKREAKKQADIAKRKAFIPIMYGQGDYHDRTLQAYEREKELIALEKERVELAQEKAKLAALKAEHGLETDKAIDRMSRNEMRRRKKR